MTWDAYKIQKWRFVFFPCAAWYHMLSSLCCHLESGRTIYFPFQINLVILVRCRKQINYIRRLSVSINQEACHFPGLDPHERKWGGGWGPRNKGGCGKQQKEDSCRSCLRGFSWHEGPQLRQTHRKTTPYPLLLELFSASQGDAVPKEACTNQKYSIMLLGQLFLHFLLLLNAERKTPRCWNKEPHSTPCLQVYPDRLCHIPRGSFPAHRQVFVEYSKGVMKQQSWLLTQIKGEIIFSADCNNSNIK